jgi:PPE-repeat protein
MGIDFAARTPDMNSAMIYSGPGATSWTTAASAWNALAAELNSAAMGYENVVAQLSGEDWQGNASTSMASSVAPYVAWMKTTAAQAEETATKLNAAAMTFEQTFASVVPPTEIATNRATTAQLVATNVLGQNSGIIAQLQALYMEMWAQDANALYTYAGQMATITKMTPPQKAPQVSSLDAPAKLTASNALVTSNTVAGTGQNTVSKALTNIASPQALTTQFGSVTGLADPTSGALTEIWFLLTGQTLFPSNLGALVNGYAPFASFFYNTEGLPYFSVGMGNFGTQIAKSAGWLGGAAPAVAKAATGAAQGLGGLGAALGGGGQVAAGLGSGAHVAGLSVPASWPGAVAPSVAKPLSAVPVSEVITAPESSGAGNLIGGVPAAGVGGAGRGAGAGPRYGFKPTVMARPLSAG